MSSFEVGGEVAWGIASRRVAAVVLLGAYAAVFTWPVASSTGRQPHAVATLAEEELPAGMASSRIRSAPSDWNTLAELVHTADGCGLRTGEGLRSVVDSTDDRRLVE
jgi:hypothetical protein